MQITTKPLWRTLRLGKFSFKLDRRTIPVFIAVSLVGFLVLVVSISYGEFDITPIEVIKTIIGIDTGNPSHHLVVWTFRMPRILVAFMVGAALAVSGTILQGITRNPLADPGILGVTPGASLAAVAMIVWFDVPPKWIPFGAFAGAMGMAFLIFTLSWKRGSEPTRLILMGVGLGAVATALINLMIVLGDIRQVQLAVVWLAGSVYGSSWEDVRMIALWLGILLPITILLARQLNMLALGDDLATGLGLHVELQRGLLLLLSVALASISVAVAGTVGFVGLVAPHITRRLVGSSHEGLVPAAALVGGVLLMFSDLVGRWVISPSELPVGIVAAMIGAPYFAYLLYQARNV